MSYRCDMSKQKTLFQSWGGQKAKTVNEQPGTSTEGHDTEDVINLCNGLEDGDDDLLFEAELTTHPDDAENLTNISIGADGFTPTQAQSQNPNCPGFDMSAGKLWIYPTNYPVRDYQFNIVKQSLFKNTMVTLPTGLGKTFIAAVVMYNFYRWYPQGKVIFMAPTKPLVAQQIEACYNIMGIPQDHTAEMTGSMGPPKREKAWHDKRVFFLTPQVLTNDLSRGSCPAQFVKCLVIDEAHKALGNHAYCQVVRELVKYTEQFRVLALSATPGSDIKAVQQVLGNLLISHIEIRTEESIDIKQYSHERIVDKVVVPLGDELTKVKTKYIHIMDSIVNKLKRHGVLYNRDTTSLSKFLILKARDAFRQNPPEKLQRSHYGIVEGDFALAMSLYHGFELLQLHGSRSLYNYLDGILSGDKGYGRTRTELCRNGDFNELIGMLKQKYSTPEKSRSPYNYLNGILSGDKGYGHTRTELCRNGDFNELIWMLKQKYSTPENQTLSQAQATPFVIGHPKMEKLQGIVLEHFRKFEDQNATTRVMIFSQYRDSVQEITDMLNVHRPLVKVMSFIGQSSAGKSTKGFTQKEQLKVMKEFREGGYNTLVLTCVGEEGLDIGDVMKEFREGGYNTLVSTCVGEEGLDIGDVDLIICFDAHKSPIRLVQRMGRTGRKREGRIVMLVTQGKEEQIYNQSQYSKRSIHRAILNGAKSLHFYQHSPRMVPEVVDPAVHKMHITINKTFKPTKKLTTETNKNEEKTAKIPSNSSKGKKPEPSDGLITKEEYEELLPWIVREDEIPKLPKSDFISLSKNDADQEDGDESGDNFLSLCEWTPWQNTLQETSDVLDHSKQSKHLVELMEFVQLQSHINPEDDPYGLEMAAYLNEDDILKSKDKTGRDSIARFCIMSENEENSNDENIQQANTKKGKAARVRNRFSDMLPVFEAETETDQGSDDDLPAFQLFTNSTAKPAGDNDTELPDLNEDFNSNLANQDDSSKDNDKSKESESETEVCIQRKIGKPKQGKLTKSDRPITHKAKALDMKMKSGSSGVRRKKIKNSNNNRSVLELLKKADDSDFENTPPDLVDTVKPIQQVDLTLDNADSNSSPTHTYDNDSHTGTDTEKCYVIRTPPSVEDAIRLCQAAELEVDRVKIDLLKLIDEWHRENENGKYIVLPKETVKHTPFDSSRERKMSRAIHDVCVNMSLTDHKKLSSPERMESTKHVAEEIHIDTKTSESSNESNNNDEQVDIESENRLDDQDAITNNDMDMSGTFSMDVQDTETLMNEEHEDGAPNDSLHKTDTSNLVENDKTRSETNTVISSETQKFDKDMNISNAKSDKFSKSTSLKKVEAVISEWVSEDSDDDLFEQIKTPHYNKKPIETSSGCNINTNTQVTFTQALNCLHSGSMTSESDSVKDVQYSDESQVNIEPSNCNADQSKMKSNMTRSISPVNKHMKNAKDGVASHKEGVVNDIKVYSNDDRAPVNVEIGRKHSSSSDDNEHPQFDLGFDIDDDIIPPSPVLTQPFQVSSKSRLSQSFTSRLSQNRLSAKVSADLGMDVEACQPKSKRTLILDDNDQKPTTGQNLSILVEEEESQSILDSGPNQNQLSPVFSQRKRNSVSNKQTNIGQDTTVNKDSKSSEDAFESSFALFDDEFDDWIDGDLGQECVNENLNEKLSTDMCKENDGREINKTDPVSNKVVSSNIESILKENKLPSNSKVKNAKKKSFAPTRKSMFLVDDLSFEDSFNDFDKQKSTTMSTPITNNRKSDINKATSTPQIDVSSVHAQFRSPAMTPVGKKNTTSSVEDLTKSDDVGDDVFPSDDNDDDSFVVRKKKKKPACLESPQSQVPVATTSRSDSSSDLSREHIAAFQQKPRNCSLKQAAVTKSSLKSNDTSSYKVSSNSDKENDDWSEDDDFDDALLLQNNDYYTMAKVNSAQNNSDDDFEETSNFKRTAGKDKSVEKSNRKKSVDQKRRSKPNRPSNPFVEEEAELSDEGDTGASSDETDASDLDKYEGSFIHDSQFTQQSQGLDETDIQALYIKSVKSPVAGRGAFKLQYDYKNIDVFSQVPKEEEESQYMEDSFCVGSEDDDWLGQEDYGGEITVCNNKSAILQSGKKRRRGMANLQTGRQREIHFGRMRALDEIRNKIAKKNKLAAVPNVYQQKMNKIPEKENSALPKGRKNRTKIQSESSSEEDVVCLPNQSRSCLVSPDVKQSKKRKRVKLLSSSDEEQQMAKIVCTQESKYSGSKPWIVSDNHGTNSAHNSSRQNKYINAINSAKQSTEVSSDDSEDVFLYSSINKTDSLTGKSSKNRYINNSPNDHLKWTTKVSSNLDKLAKSTDIAPGTWAMTKIKDRSQNSDYRKKEVVSVIAKPHNSSFNQAGVTRFCDNTKEIKTTMDGTRLQTTHNDKSYILVDSKEVSGAQDIISDLRFKHKIHVSAAQLQGCDYIVSNRMAVERKQWSDFSNGANRVKLVERIQHLRELYDRPCLIVEKDRVKPGEEKFEKPVHWTKYIDKTCAMLLKSQVKVLFTDTQAETASVLADLCDLEKRKNMNISVPVEICEKKPDILSFYTSIPSITYTHALNLSFMFDKISDFLRSSVSEIEMKGKMSTRRATEVFNFIQRDFDISMLPTKHK